MPLPMKVVLCVLGLFIVMTFVAAWVQAGKEAKAQREQDAFIRRLRDADRETHAQAFSAAYSRRGSRSTTRALDRAQRNPGGGTAA